MRSTVLRLLCLLAYANPIFAQQKPAGELAPTSTVSGHVFCADTNAPARMATVILQPADMIDSWKQGEENHSSYRGEAVETLLDGSFTMQHVAPGSYYVVASQQGYISPLASLYFPASDQHALESGSEPASQPLPAKKIPVSAQRITVQANLPVSVNVTLERGAAVSGTSLFDDGSPASGLRVSLLIRWKDKWIDIPSNPFEQSSASGQTNDQGNYRISGLPPREYLLKVEIDRMKSTYSVDKDGGTSVSMSHLYSLAFYAGGKTRPTDGVAFTLSAGDERHGEDIEIPVSKLHIVRGSITAARDGHVLNGGQLSLLYADDKSVAGHTSLADGDEVFTFSFVPEGDYIVRVDSASDNEYVEVPAPAHSAPPTSLDSHTIRSYGSADQPIHVSSDMTGVTIAVPDLPEQKNPSKP
jgi:hypothetical protein